MANLSEIANAMFRYRNKWDEITDKDKELHAFIFTRYFCKKYPEMSEMVNSKMDDKVTTMNMWYYFMEGKGYPGWFWGGSTKKDKQDINDKDFNLLMIKLKMDKRSDLEYMIKYYPEIIKEELKYYKKK